MGGQKKEKAALRMSRNLLLTVDGGGRERENVPCHNPESPHRPNSQLAFVPHAYLE